MKKSITLCEPVDINGKAFTTLDMRRPTLGDEEDALDEAIQLGRGDNALTGENCLIGGLVGLSYDQMRGLPTPVYKQLRQAYIELTLPKGAAAEAKKADGGRNEEAALEGAEAAKTPKKN